LYNNILFNKNYNAPLLFADDYFTKPSTINLLNYNFFNTDSTFESLEESYENIKNFKFLYFLNYKDLKFNFSNFIQPTSYTLPLDYFRADYDENN
jgi:hypothetical protein